MTNRNQHFVPKFYLRLFQSAPKRIHLYNLDRMLARKGISIRDQCYKRYFYGKDDTTEKALSFVEGHIAGALRRVTETRQLPIEQSEDYRKLLLFVGLQLLRTPKASDEAARMFGKVHTRASKGGAFDIPEFNKVDILDNADLNLSMVPEVVTRIQDLKSHLVVSSTKSFITGDAPVFKYNQYCEGIQNVGGVLGVTSKGIQFFVPVSPNLYLVLYDGTTYRVRSSADRRSRTTKAKQSDIDQLNLLQLLSADRNVYFSEWEQLKAIQRLLPEFNKMHKEDTTVLREYGQDDDPNSSLLVMFEQMTNVSLHLSFLNTRMSANRIPLVNRYQLLRNKRLQAEQRRMRKMSGGKTVTFSRFLGET